MKKQKMSLEKMRGVLSNVLSREQMREVQAGSGNGQWCGFCGNLPGEISDCTIQGSGYCGGCGRMYC